VKIKSQQVMLAQSFILIFFVLFLLVTIFLLCFWFPSFLVKKYKKRQYPPHNNVPFKKRNCICEDFQSGFRSCQSTETDLICSYHPILVASLYLCYWILVLHLIPSTTTFFWIDLKITLALVELHWHGSYLSDWYQFVAVNEEASYW